jgi:hypothetical protein
MGCSRKNGGRDWDRTSDPCDVNARETAENKPLAVSNLFKRGQVKSKD